MRASRAQNVPAKAHDTSMPLLLSVLTLLMASFTPVAAHAAGEPPNPMTSMVVPIALTFLVVYVLLVRPTNKQRAEQQAFLSGLKTGDEVVTSSGLIGRIASLEEHVVLLELADKVKVRMMRDRISSPYSASKTEGSSSQRTKA